MLFNFLSSRPNSGRALRKPTSPCLSVEALNDRFLPSAVVPAPPAAAALVDALSGTAEAYRETLDVDGTFAVTNVHGSKLSAAVEGNLILDGGDPLHFTIDAHVKVMGNKIEGTPTMVFDDRSTLTFYYELKLNKDTGIFEGNFWITSGTGQFQGASGRGDISYPVAESGPLIMDGTLSR